MIIDSCPTDDLAPMMTDSSPTVDTAPRMTDSSPNDNPARMMNDSSVIDPASIINESVIERNRRLDRERIARKRSNLNSNRPPLIEGESKQQRNKRLRQERQARIRHAETSSQRNERLAKNNKYLQLWRNENNATVVNEDRKLEILFEDKMKALTFVRCSTCKKRELSFTKKGKCAACERPTEINMFSSENNMDPGIIPNELSCLTALEELLIAKVHPVISVYKTKGQQMHYSGHVINFPQDVKEFSTKLPDVAAAVNSIIVVRKEGNETHAHTDFRVSGARVKKALTWLKNNNQYYSDIEIDEESLALLPKDGNMSELLRHVEVQKDTSPSKDEDDENVVTTSVPTLTTVNQDRQIQAVLDNAIPWPTIQNTPIDEFRTAGYIVCAFPKLFPFGNADLRQGRLKKIGESDYFKFLMLYDDGRFANHSRFPFFAMNTLLRWNALNQGKVFVRRNLAGKTMDDLKTLLHANKNLSNQIMFYGSSIRGTKAYWFKRCGELLAMVDQLGTPTVFFTLSAADLHWPDLFRLLKPDMGDGEQLNHNERTKLMCENPHIVATFFEKRGTFFIENIMKKKFDITDYWFRFEWQHRGSPHIHGVFWMKGAPNVDGLQEKSDAYKASVIKYFDKLVSTWNPDQKLPPGNLHPCQVRLDSIAEDSREEDYTNMLNKVQRHTICSEAYCLRKKKGGSKVECRFKFPKEEHSETELMLENGSLRLLTKRNDQRLNSHNPFITSLWRANTDFQPIMSRQAVINYIAKYASKSEPQSESYKEMMATILEKGKDDDPARKAVQKLLMKTVAERDYSSQEVVHTLMGYPLYHCTRQFVVLTLKNEAWVALSRGEDETGQNFVEKYKSRPSLYEEESLFNFSKNYYKKGEKWIKRRKPAIVQVYPKLKLSAESTVHEREDYFRQQVLLYLNWKSEEEIKLTHGTWQSAYEYNNLEVFSSDLNLDNADEDEYEEDADEEVLELEEFMVAARDGPNQDLLGVEIGNRELDLNFNWNGTFEQYDASQIASFLSDAKKDEGEDERTYKYPDVILTAEQNAAITLLNDQISSIRNTFNPKVSRTIVQGKGGSGKSTLIQAMTARLYEEFGSESFRIMAPTGSAAVNIGGSTIHSGLHIGISKDLRKLDGESLRQFQLNMKDVKFLIFDEYSMVGSNLLGKIDQRCREAKPETATEVFGGLCVFFLGDIKQLPPVMDSAAYGKGKCSGIGANGRIAYHSFQKCIILGDSQRQSGTDQMQFRDLLDRLSLGESTNEDWKILESRSISKIRNFEEEFKDAIRLFPTNELTQDFNMKKLIGLNVPVARIRGKHNCLEASKGSSDAAQGLSKELFVSKGSRIMLRSNLWTTKGLVNGATGTVNDIVYRPGESPADSLPLALIVKWDHYKGPTLQGGLFPVTPVTRYWDDKAKSCSRTQFPVTLAWAITIHKSQGMTLKQAVVDVGEKEFSAGLTYVALSRMKSLAGVAIDPPFGFERLKNIGKSIQLKERVCEELRLKNL